MPNELLNEIFGSFPLKKAFWILAKIPNSLLRRNVEKMLKSVEEVNYQVFKKFNFQAMKQNKWNERDCAQSINIYERGLIVMQHLNYSMILKKLSSFIFSLQS